MTLLSICSPVIAEPDDQDWKPANGREDVDYSSHARHIPCLTGPLEELYSRIRTDKTRSGDQDTAELGIGLITSIADV